MKQRHPSDSTEQQLVLSPPIFVKGRKKVGLSFLLKESLLNAQKRQY